MIQRRGWSTILILTLTLLLITSCKGGASEDPQDTAAALKAVQSGTQGVEARPIANFPPALLYDEQELNLIVEVFNRGSHDVEPQDCFVQVSGFDPNIIQGGLNVPRSCGDTLGTLEGKNIYNTKGSFNQLEFQSSTINLPLGVNEYSPTLIFDTCYRYHTIATPTICIDPQTYNLVETQKACRAGSVSAGGGQGGPVGVGTIGVTMVGSRAVFDISVTAHGSGVVLSPSADIQNCAYNNWDFKEINRVAYNVQMSGASLVDCKPNDGYVRLNSGQGKVICTFEVPNTGAYETPLIIDLDYGYKESFRQPVKIVHSPN